MAHTTNKALWAIGLLAGVTFLSGLYFYPSNRSYVETKAAAVPMTIAGIKVAKQALTVTPSKPAPASSAQRVGHTIQQATATQPMLTPHDTSPAALALPVPQVLIIAANAVTPQEPQSKLKPVSVPGPVSAAVQNLGQSPQAVLPEATPKPALARLATEAVVVTAQRPQQVARVDVESLSRGNSLTIVLPKRRP